MIIALASPQPAASLSDGLEKVKQLIAQAASQGAEIVCFPEAYLPGLRGMDFIVPEYTQQHEQLVIQTATNWASQYGIALVLGMELITGQGRVVAAAVIDSRGQLLGYQTKNQLDPTEDQFYVPGVSRQLFQVNGVKFGVAICHEGFRYPETVRWAAIRGAQIVFHPHCTGSDKSGVQLKEWGARGSPYYEQAMLMRSRENTIYFASVNYALKYQESATSIISPSGECTAYLPYGQQGVLVQEIDVKLATGLLARRYAPERYSEINV